MRIRNRIFADAVGLDHRYVGGTLVGRGEHGNMYRGSVESIRLDPKQVVCVLGNWCKEHVDASGEVGWVPSGMGDRVEYPFELDRVAFQTGGNGLIFVSTGSGKRVAILAPKTTRFSFEELRRRLERRIRNGI